MKCQKCGEETFLPFRCPYCAGYFCSEHRLPENHECPKIECARAPAKEENLVQQIQRPYEYSLTYVPVARGKKFHFSKKEVVHLAAASLLVFAVGLSLGLSLKTYITIGGFIMLLVSALLVAVSFLAHELAHKFTAQRKGLWAEFRLMFAGLIITAISIISPLFKIISPGAVVIYGFAGKKVVGKISIAGPFTNIVLAILLTAVWLINPQYSLILYAAAFNAWIAFFNLIPLGILDGFKVFTWNKTVWAAAFTLSLALTILTYWHL
ncbi:MAG: AN1-type zinc finger domain-containing protein [Candidatus Bathyarchaeia archaeon]